MKKFVPTATQVLLVSLLVCFFCGPFATLVATSLKSERELVGSSHFFPSEWHWENYARAVTQIPFARFFVNTLALATVTMIGVVTSSSMAAYALSRMRWWGRDAFFSLTLGTILLPQLVTMIPTFLIFKQLGWVGTYLPLIVPAFCGNALFIFLLRQFMLQIPPELNEAARIDGASEFAIWSRIILPLSKPAVTVVAMMAFVSSWNDFLTPLIYLTNYEQFTLSLGLQQFLGQHSAEFSLLMAAATLMMLPILVLFLVFQRNFISMVVSSGLSN